MTSEDSWPSTRADSCSRPRASSVWYSPSPAILLILVITILFVCLIAARIIRDFDRKTFLVFRQPIVKMPNYVIRSLTIISHYSSLFLDSIESILLQLYLFRPSDIKRGALAAWTFNFVFYVLLSVLFSFPCLLPHFFLI